jgi:hypothetical protein
LRDAEWGEQHVFREDGEGLARDLLEDSGEDLCEATAVVLCGARLVAEWARQDELYGISYGIHL